MWDLALMTISYKPLILCVSQYETGVLQAFSITFSAFKNPL